MVERNATKVSFNGKRKCQILDDLGFPVIFRTCSIYDECHQTFDVTRTSSRPKDTMLILALRII